MKLLRQFAVIALLFTTTLALVACRSENRHVPPGALMLAEGNQRLTARADYDGTVYIIDTDRDQLVYSGKIEEGQTVSIDPREDEIRIDNNVVVEDRLRSGNRHRIFFERGEKVERVVERRTRIEERRERD